MHAKNLSCVNGGSLSKKSINTDNAIEPVIDLIKKLFPNLIIAKISNGIFKNKIVLPIGIFNK